jgi:ribosomal protein S18 acetylase RimI-like enzyme
MTADIHIAPISAGAHAEIDALVRIAHWRYEHFDYRRGEVFEHPGYLARDSAGRLLAILSCELDRPPVASIVYAVMAREVRSPCAVIAALLRPCEAEQRRAGAQALAFVGLAPWLATCLERAGFVERTRVITYQRFGNPPALAGRCPAVLRLARPDDAELLAALDAAAFEPLWRYAAQNHRQQIGRLPYVAIAEIEGQPAGYVSCDILYAQGHIVRLVVHPQWQRRGLGTWLLTEALRFFARRDVMLVHLNTQADNVASRRLYERMGFQQTGEGVPALVKSLTNGDGGRHERDTR